MGRIEEDELRRSKRLAQYQSLSAMQQHHAMAPNNHQVGQIAGRSVTKVDSGDSVASRMKQMQVISTHEDRLQESKVTLSKKSTLI